ncbi:MAG: hypothetical protein F6K28_36065 [Microcoleus sp. SIO2G3]|nr:hypothetical protein [Microcoleus sp. SIO2G3]
MLKSISKRSACLAGAIAAASLSWGTSAIAAQPEGNPVPPQPAPPSDGSAGFGQQVGQMFSPEIQAAMTACSTAGGVDLVASASTANSLTCGDGSSIAIPYASYLDTASNFLAASLLLGLSYAAVNDPRVTPSVASQFFSDQGANVLRQELQQALAQSPFIAPNSPDSIGLLTDAIVERATDTLGNLPSFSALLGTPEQSSQVLTSFCTPPGTSVAQAQGAVPGLTPTQLYAICLNQAGLPATPGS